MSRKIKQPPYIRVGTFPIDMILKNRTEVSGHEKLNFNGHVAHMGSMRYRVFARSLSCVCCGIKGEFFALERSRGDLKKSPFHFNLYAIGHYGHEVLMTKDHIIPKSKGGSEEIENMQTMCTDCNRKKGDKIV